MLTQEQINHFQTFGFLTFRQLFSQDELKTINTEFETAMTEAFRDDPFDGTRRHWLITMGPDTPFLASLLEDPRFCDTAEQLYGEDVFGIASDINRYVGDTRWHPDTGSLHQYGVKFAYYLQPVTAETGALRLIPGSHEPSFHGELRKKMDELELEIPDVPAYIFESEPGDVVAFDVRCWHASWGGAVDRRMCVLVYYNNPKTPEEAEATKKQIIGNGVDYGPWVANAEGKPKREQWINRMQELAPDAL